VLIRSAVVLVLLALGGWGAASLHHRLTYGTVAGEKQPTLSVDRGDRFSIGVRDLGSSVGDHWTAQAAPQGALDGAGEHHVSDSLLDRLGIGTQNDGGGAGTTYFSYDARQAGTATVTLTNCFQGCHRPSRYSRSVTWTITVK
jgi:hypothetical protein